MSTELTDEQKRILSEIRSSGKKIGYATGVWDLFHEGHLFILNQSKEKCDFLVVGISTDENCYSYKNKFPIVKFDKRKKMLESIKYCDMVVPQLSMDKLKAHDLIKFDFLFHGDDLKYPFEEELKKKGASIIYITRIPGISSTLRRPTNEN